MIRMSSPDASVAPQRLCAHSSDRLYAAVAASPAPCPCSAARRRSPSRELLANDVRVPLRAVTTCRVVHGSARTHMPRGNAPHRFLGAMSRLADIYMSTTAMSNDRADIDTYQQARTRTERSQRSPWLSTALQRQRQQRRALYRLCACTARATSSCTMGRRKHELMGGT